MLMKTRMMWGVAVATGFLGVVLFAGAGQAAIVDLSAAGCGVSPCSGTINGAIFQNDFPQPAGTGVFGTFVSIQARGTATTEQGYNTDGRPVPFDENNAAPVTHSLRLSEVPIVNIGGTDYRQFLLDIIEPIAGGPPVNVNKRFISLDELQIYLNLTNGAQTTQIVSTLGTLVYDLDTVVVDNWIKLNAALAPGSGKGDMAAYIPNTLFVGVNDPFVYLYSQFGLNFAADSGFEEWAVRGAPVPEPGTLLLIASGLAGIGIGARRRNRRR